MVARPAWLWLWLICLGLHGAVARAADVLPPAQRLWELGQAAMRQGQTDQAIDCYRQSLRLDPTLARNHLSLAAAYLGKGDEARACPHLKQYVRLIPEHCVIRFHYAELLLRLHQPEEARAQYELFVADAQAEEELAERHLIHCHSRLMEIAETAEDEYQEHLNRGIGLYLLARQRAALPEPDDQLPVEGLLCKAAGELTLARMQRPAEARPCWYLYEVWSRLAQQQPARRWLRRADEAAPFSYLTPSEQSSLHLACQRLEAAAARK